MTTVADAGSSGASTFLGLKKFIMERSRTNVKAFLHVANHGLASAGCTGVDKGGECDSLNQVNVGQAIKCIKTYPDDIVGTDHAVLYVCVFVICVCVCVCFVCVLVGV